MKVSREVHVCDFCQETLSDVCCFACNNAGKEVHVCASCGVDLGITDHSGAITCRLCPNHAVKLQKLLGMVK